MQKKIFFLVGLLTQFFSIALNAQNTSASSPQEQNSILWKISGKGLQKPSYLFGTIHLICNNDYFFNSAMQTAFSDCEKLLLEINLNDPNTIAQYQQSMMLPNGKELKNFFENEQDYQVFSEKLKKQTGIDANLFQGLKPLILLSLIAQKSMECENTSSYEMNLIEMSTAKRMPVEGLETSLSQMKIFDNMKDAEIKGILMEGLDDMEKDNQLQHQMVEMYKNQNIDALHQLILSSKELRNQEDALINNRNRDWVGKLPKHMESKACFIAVGAGHLAGKQGVIQLLRNAGYTVSAVVN